MCGKYPLYYDLAFFFCLGRKSKVLLLDVKTRSQSAKMFGLYSTPEVLLATWRCLSNIRWLLYLLQISFPAVMTNIRICWTEQNSLAVGFPTKSKYFSVSRNRVVQKSHSSISLVTWKVPPPKGIIVNLISSQMMPEWCNYIMPRLPSSWFVKDAS